jgi:hypothetical protein
VALSRYIYRGDEFAIRSPLWWRDLLLGLTFGIALFFFLSDALHWETFKKHIFTELIFIGVPLGLAILSPRRLLTVFIGLSLLLFRFIFLIFLFENRWSALVTIVWAIALILLGREVNRRYRMLEVEIPDGTTGLEFLVLMLGVGAAFGMLFLLRRILGLT